MSAFQVDIEETLALCMQARAKLGRTGSFRARVLLDMALIELYRELKTLTNPTSEPSAADVDDAQKVSRLVVADRTAALDR